MRDPLGRMFPNLPREVRVVLDWVFTIGGAIVIVLALKAWVVNPYRIPSSSMEPTLHCARPATGCEAHFSDRVLANRFIYHFRDPKRGEIIVFKTPGNTAGLRHDPGARGVREAADRPAGRPHQRSATVSSTSTASLLKEPYVKPDRRDHFPPRDVDRPEGRLLLHGRQPERLVRLAHLGAGSAGEPDRRGLLRLLAAEPHQLQVDRRPRAPIRYHSASARRAILL